MEFKKGAQGAQQQQQHQHQHQHQQQHQHQHHQQNAYGPLAALVGGQAFYTLETLEASQNSQQQIYPPGTSFAPIGGGFQSASDGTIPPGPYASITPEITMPPPETGMSISISMPYYNHQGNIAPELVPDYARGGAYSDPSAHASYGTAYSLHPRPAPGSMAPPRYALDEHYVPQEGYNPWLRDDPRSGNSNNILLQQGGRLAPPLSFAAAASDGEWESHPNLPKPLPKSQVWTAGTSGTAKKKMASQFKRFPALHATKKNSHVKPPKQRGPILSGPGGSGWCSVCEIECNSKEVLDQHCLGRKHKRKLEKKEELLAFQKKTNEKHMQQRASGNTGDKLKRDNKTDTQSHSDNNLMNGKKNKNDIKSQADQQQVETGSSQQLDKNQKPGGEADAKASDSNLGKRKQKVKAAADDIDTKRQRLLDAGTAIAEVKTCTLCNAVCNSQIVFDSHLTGKKHAAQVKKLEEEANAASQGNKIVEEANADAKGKANADAKGKKLEAEASAVSQSNNNGVEGTGELDKDGKAD